MEQLLHLIKIRQAELQVALAAGIPTSWDAYQKMVGEYQGLQSVLTMIDRMYDEEDRE
jgi:hypothetical protein